MIALCDNDEEGYCKYTHDDVIELASENLGSFTYIFEGQKTMSTSTAFTFTIDRVNIPEDYFPDSLYKMRIIQYQSPLRAFII